VQLLASHAELPPIAAADLTPGKQTAFAGPGSLPAGGDALDECLSRMLPGLTALLPRPARLVVVKAAPQFAALLTAKHAEGCERAELSDEDLLESAVPYIQNLEALWRKSIDHMTILRSDCETWSREIERKNARISELEVEGRTLWRQYVALKADVSRLKLSTVPPQLRDSLRLPLAPAGTEASLLLPAQGDLPKSSSATLAAATAEAPAVKFGREHRRLSSVQPLGILPRAPSGLGVAAVGGVLIPKAPLTAR
jgi:hypothetical protein